MQKKTKKKSNHFPTKTKLDYTTSSTHAKNNSDIQRTITHTHTHLYIEIERRPHPYRRKRRKKRNARKRPHMYRRKIEQIIIFPNNLLTMH
jgi:hypothetical protein